LLRTRSIIAAALGVAIIGGPLLATQARAADEVVVRSGDTLTSISQRHGVSIRRLVEVNRIADPSRIYAGQRLRLVPAPRSPKPEPKARAASPAAARTHTVRAGEHLTGIARRYGLSIADIVAANRIADPSRIFAGQRLAIPSTAAPSAPRPDPKAPAPAQDRAHTVRAGEHLTGIARRYGVSIAQIVTANRIANPSRIYAGQRLAIPARTGSATTAAPAGRSMPASMAALVARRDGVRRVIVEEARRFDVPVAFALAVAWQESGWQQGVVSSANAIGVMQLLPSTADWVGEAMLGTRLNPRDLRHNVRGGVRLLAHYLDRYDGDRARVLAAYYQGQTAVDRYGIYPVSRPYIASIAALEAIFGD
jgi:LysM repeat protein